MLNEPTKEMIEAALYAFNDVHADEPRPSLRECFAITLRAALAVQPREGSMRRHIAETIIHGFWERGEINSDVYANMCSAIYKAQIG